VSLYPPLRCAYLNGVIHKSFPSVIPTLQSLRFIALLTSICIHTKAFCLLIKSDIETALKGKQAILPETYCFIFSALISSFTFPFRNGEIMIRVGKPEELRAKSTPAPLIPSRTSHETTQD
jgi:hypothetical protein